MLDFAVVGSGVGGSCSALMLDNRYKTVLFEKDSNLGGCSSTFRRKGALFNAGATTFAGYEEGSYLYHFFKTHGVYFESKPLSCALHVIQQGHSIRRYNLVEHFIQEINQTHYHGKNDAFYRLIYTINRDFYAQSGYYYSNRSLGAKMRSLLSFRRLLFRFYPYLFTDARSFITRFFGSVSDEYLDYIDNQLLIVAQAKSHEVNFLTAALALGYQFQQNHYVYGGMGSIFEAIAKNLRDVRRNSEIQRIEPFKERYILHGAKQSVEAKNVVLNTTVFDAPKLFDTPRITKHFERYSSLDSSLSAFVCYIKLKVPHYFDHHYQLIEKDPLPHSVSNSIFVSFGDGRDRSMQKSVTISIHVDKRQWQTQIEQKQQALEGAILALLHRRLGLKKDDIEHCFSAKPGTYARFINRSSLGGIPLLRRNLVHTLPGNDTPFRGLYMVGDTSYAAQGWPGVMMGVQNLERLLCKI